jgi:hypothetical protein
MTRVVRIVAMPSSVQFVSHHEYGGWFPVEMHYHRQDRFVCMEMFSSASGFTMRYTDAPLALLRLQGWARRCLLRKRHARRLALAMAMHARLGAASGLYTLPLDLLESLLIAA